MQRHSVYFWLIKYFRFFYTFIGLKQTLRSCRVVFVRVSHDCRDDWIIWVTMTHDATHHWRVKERRHTAEESSQSIPNALVRRSSVRTRLSVSKYTIHFFSTRMIVHDFYTTNKTRPKNKTHVGKHKSYRFDKLVISLIICCNDKV